MSAIVSERVVKKREERLVEIQIASRRNVARDAAPRGMKDVYLNARGFFWNFQSAHWQRDRYAMSDANARPS